MMETDNLSRSQSIGQRDGSPGSHSPSRPMRQLEFNQAMSDFRHMFPETDEEVIEAVLRANSGMVDATIDQLLTMNIDAEFGKEDEEDDDLPDHVLVEVEQEVLAQQQQQQMMQAAPPPPPPPAFRESSSRSSKKAQEAFVSSKGGSEDCPPSYTEAVQSHPSHYRGSSSRRHNHKHSPTPSAVLSGYNNNNGSAAASAGASGNTNAAGARMSSGGGGGGGHHHHLHRMPRNGMQHLLDLGPESAPSATAGGANTNASPSVTGSPAVIPPTTTQTGGSGGGGHASRSSRHHYHHHHHHHHPQRGSNHHRRRGGLDANPDVVPSSSSSPHKSSSRPGRNLLLASMSASAQAHNNIGPNHELASDEFGYRPPRKGSFDNNDYSPDSRQEKSPQRWRYGGRESTSVKRPAFRNWNPPMLGTLPDDFLRLTPLSTSPIPTHTAKHASSLQRTMSALGPERPRFLTNPASTTDHHHRQTSSPDVGQMTSSFRHTDRTTTSSSSSRPHRSLSFAGHSSHRQPPPRRAPTTLHPAANLAQHEFSTDILQERLKENERRRHLAASNRLDPELTQYLEDERLAILMQNSEFLQTLRGDRSFMMALEQDHSGEEVEELTTTAAATTTTSSLGDTLTSTDVTFEPVNPNGIEVEEEGYGDEGRQTLEAFPFSKQLPPPNTSEDMELRKKLKHMGKASKKQFATLARKFFSKRRKKNAHQILKESQAPSMMNLLDNEDEEEDDDDNTAENGTNGGMYSDSYGTSGSGNLRNSWNERSGRHFDEV